MTLSCASRPSSRCAHSSTLIFLVDSFCLLNIQIQVVIFQLLGFTLSARLPRAPELSCLERGNGRWDNVPSEYCCLSSIRTVFPNFGGHALTAMPKVPHTIPKRAG